MTTYKFWQDALAGKFGPVHDGHPQLGFFKRRHKNKAGEISWTPVAIWSLDGVLHAVEGGKTVDPSEIWISCCQHPITEEVYRRVESGGGWPDAIESLIGDNNPPTDEAEADEVENACKAALEAAKQPITNQTEADRLGNHRDRLAKLYTTKEKERKDEKEPHLEAGRQVDAKFKPILAKVEDAGKIVKGVLTKWLVAEQNRINAENAAKEKADREAREAAAAANQPLPEPAPVQEVARPKVGTTGRATALRTFKSARVTDYAKALAYFAENSEVKELIQTLADRAARADIAVPGCEIHSEQRAA